MAAQHSHMKLIAHLALFALLPFLSGCLTANTLRAAKAPTTKYLRDAVFHVKEAAITKDNHLCILFDGSLADSAQKDHFTLAIPLGQIRTNAQDGTLNVPRSAIQAGWAIQESSTNDLELVQVGKPVSIMVGDFIQQHLDEFVLPTNTTRILYPISHYSTEAITFVYVDDSIKQKLTIIEIGQLAVTKNKHKGYYFLLPLTIPLDVATAPIQIPFFGILFLINGGQFVNEGG
ncbi:MAG TPA: hypothetical protein VGM58_10065 [Verrucomicrobiae bacterium]|jgi:hypothetical protein